MISTVTASSLLDSRHFGYKVIEAVSIISKIKADAVVAYLTDCKHSLLLVSNSVRAENLTLCRLQPRTSGVWKMSRLTGQRNCQTLNLPQE